MTEFARAPRVLGAVASVAVLVACEGRPSSWAHRPFTHDYTFPSRDAGGSDTVLTVGAGQLDRGRMDYLSYCARCHGEDGDGSGREAGGLAPPPRDFRGPFKFASVRAGELPTDDDLLRMIRHGMEGSAMIGWGLPRRRALNVAHFLKTFPRKAADPRRCDERRYGERACADALALGREPSRWLERRVAGARAGELAPIGRPIPIPDEPPASRAGAPPASGVYLYHLKAQCSSCHPSYAPESELRAMAAARGVRAPSPRARMHESTVVAAKDNPHRADLRAPDFTRDELRTANDRRAIYRVIAAGIGGVMPAWVDALAPDEMWALAGYVDELASLRHAKNHDRLRELERRLGSPTRAR
jgi:mono/diheme cytochrome c family protein